MTSSSSSRSVTRDSNKSTIMTNKSSNITIMAILKTRTNNGIMATTTTTMINMVIMTNKDIRMRMNMLDKTIIPLSKNTADNTNNLLHNNRLHSNDAIREAGLRLVEMLSKAAED